MFYHNFKYRIKCIIRDKNMMFWTLLFPILLATLFNLSLSNISNAEDFSPVNIAIVKEGEYSENKEFIKTINSLSKGESDDPLFDIEYTSKAKAKDLLDNNNIDGYLYFDKDIKIMVKDKGINQTIIKSFVDEYKQTESTIKTIMKENPSAIQSVGIDNLFKKTDYIKEVSVSKTPTDESINYFYALIAMSCLYGGFLGLKEISQIQANQSPQGARISVAPVHKLKAFMASMVASTTIQLFDISVLMAYLYFVLKISFSNQIGYILLACIVGTITGVTFGIFLGTVIKKSEGVKTGILVGLTMTMSFLAGMMYDKMKYIINSKMPILSYLNPVNLIADSFYSLYYYDTTTKFFINIGVLCILSVIFSGITCLVLRRQKYASL